MTVNAGPNIVEDGLILSLDAANLKSFKGEPTTNLVPNPTVNAYPTIGNSWGTYNVNQYNNANYFSIGGISSISSNIITTASSHPLRTYDVVRPQTTGGGVTAGTDYFVKKLSNTTFTLHQYNNSQDGSQGYINTATGNHKVYDSIANDIRISVTSSAFPDMWWGAPHIPNSGLVKEIISKEFTGISQTSPTDCIRLHYIRDDDVKDGMAYGVDAIINTSSSVTVSFYTRSTDSRAVGKTIQYYIWNYQGDSVQAYAFNFNLGPERVWQRQSFTFSPKYINMISYWFPQSSGKYSWDWSCMQIEQKPYATNFVAGTRGATVSTGGGWGDLSGNSTNGELFNGVAYDSSNLGILNFDGINDYIQIPQPNISMFPNNWTIEGWINPGNQYSFFINPSDNGIDNFTIYDASAKRIGLAICEAGDVNHRYIYTNSNTVPLNTWSHFAYSINNLNVKIYVNGQLSYSVSETIPISNWSGTWDIGRRGNATNYFLGKIGNLKIYNTELSSQQINNNFNALRGRYGI